MKCPFFKGDGIFSINCEAPMHYAVRVQLLFRSKAELVFHMKEYCDKNYKYCEVYQMTLSAKYPDD